jgi:hypothetical protein
MSDRLFSEIATSNNTHQTKPGIEGSEWPRLLRFQSRDQEISLRVRS